MCSRMLPNFGDKSASMSRISAEIAIECCSIAPEVKFFKVANILAIASSFTCSVRPSQAALTGQ